MKKGHITIKDRLWASKSSLLHNSSEKIGKHCVSQLFQNFGNKQRLIAIRGVFIQVKQVNLFFLFIEFISVTLVNKVYRFKVYSSTTHDLYTGLCVHQPQYAQTG